MALLDVIAVYHYCQAVDCSADVWKYHMAEHYKQCHPLLSVPESFTVSDEERKSISSYESRWVGFLAFILWYPFRFRFVIWPTSVLNLLGLRPETAWNAEITMTVIWSLRTGPWGVGGELIENLRLFT